MASSTRQAIACVCLIFTLFLHAHSQTGPEKRPAATFSGKVTIKGKGVSGIAVGLVRIEDSMAQAARHRTLTDDQGNYRISNVGPGKYQLMVAAPGFIPAPGSDTNKTFLISKAETVENVDFALVRGGVITGKIIDADGRPLIEEEVMIFPVESRQGFFQHTAPIHARTDDRGIYRMFGVAPGKYRVAAGRDDGDSFGMRGGGFRRTFHPSAIEASEATIIEVTEASEATGVDITLPEPTVYYSARGRIIDDDTGQPLANVTYGVRRYLNENSTTSLTTGAVTTKDGEFKLENLSPGKYAVFIEVPPDSDWRADFVRFEVIDHDVTNLTVTASRGGSASGVIVLEGTDDKTVNEQLRRARIYAQVSGQDLMRTSMQAATINPDGSFRIGGLQAGIVNFGISIQRFQIVRIERGGVAQPQGIELKEREQITGLRLIVNYANGAVQGVVKLDDGSIPASGSVFISLKRLGVLPTPFANSRESAQVDARGQFFADGLLAGTYEVTAVYALDRRPPVRRTTQQVVVTSGAVTNVTLTVDQR